MAEFIYTMTKARKAHGDKVILDDVTMSFYPGAKIGVVGPNGAGKSTLANVLMGLPDYAHYEGEIVYEGESLRGVPPASLTPFLVDCAWRIRAMLQGAASFQHEATPTKGWWISASVKPMA